MMMIMSNEMIFENGFQVRMEVFKKIEKSYKGMKEKKSDGTLKRVTFGFMIRIML